MALGQARQKHDGLRAWMASTRLNPRNAAADYLDDPVAREAQAAFKEFGPAAAAHLQAMVRG